jgi:chemotaxis response regulator CheB
MQRSLEEKFSAVKSSLTCLEKQIPCDAKQMSMSLQFTTSMLTINKLMQLKPCQVVMLEALTNQRYALKIAQLRL